MSNPTARDELIDALCEEGAYSAQAAIYMADAYRAEMLAGANQANAVLRERVAELEVALVDAQCAPHTGCCPSHEWRGPDRDTSAEACEDIRQHEAETHDKEIDHG